MASLTRNQYYSNQNLFSRLGIKAEELIGQEFDDILKLVERCFRKDSLKCHPDKVVGEKEKKIAEEKFKKLSADKDRLEQYLNALKAGRIFSMHTTSPEGLGGNKEKSMRFYRVEGRL
ncbi:hypothetical protein [Wolbachia endosymbiont of Encarsia formosa]|uniref:hypothetical protein n=1 Tax=Wolbachia endosymbiont of Encarsia formosa TaxID=77125 RepID=UPI0031BB3879